jgi:hypothetical protein
MGPETQLAFAALALYMTLLGISAEDKWTILINKKCGEMKIVAF